jgi:hypothetical protein
MLTANYPDHFVTLRSIEDQAVVRTFMKLHGIKRIARRAYGTADMVHGHKGKCYSMVGHKVQVFDTTAMVMLKTAHGDVISKNFEGFGETWYAPLPTTPGLFDRIKRRQPVAAG